MGRRQTVNLDAHIDEAADAVLNLKNIWAWIKQAEEAENNAHWPRPIGWPPEPDIQRQEAVKIWEDGQGLLTYQDVADKMMERHPYKWSVSMIRNSIRMMNRYRALEWLRKASASGLL